MTQPDTEQDGDSLTDHRWIRRLRQTRFTQLLAALSLLLLTAPIANVLEGEVSRAVASLLVVVVLILVLIAAAAAVSNTRRQAWTALVLAGSCLIVIFPRLLSEGPDLEVPEGLLTILFLSYVVCLIINALFRQRYVTYDMIAASLCGYLLIGVIFSVVYSLVITFDPGAVSVNSSGAAETADLHFGDHRTVTSLYFSFVTLTTLGYGDLTPVSTPARMLTATEALIGQLYLVVLVSRLVALHIASGLPDRTRDDPGATGQH